MPSSAAVHCTNKKLDTFLELKRERERGEGHKKVIEKRTGEKEQKNPAALSEKVDKEFQNFLSVFFL